MLPGKHQLGFLTIGLGQGLNLAAEEHHGEEAVSARAKVTIVLFVMAPALILFIISLLICD